MIEMMSLIGKQTQTKLTVTIKFNRGLQRRGTESENLL